MQQCQTGRKFVWYIHIRCLRRRRRFRPGRTPQRKIRRPPASQAASRSILLIPTPLNGTLEGRDSTKVVGRLADTIRRKVVGRRRLKPTPSSNPNCIRPLISTPPLARHRCPRVAITRFGCGAPTGLAAVRSSAPACGPSTSSTTGWCLAPWTTPSRSGVLSP